MKTYACDFCHSFIDSPFMNVQIQEIKIKGKRGKKEKIHLCKNCITQIINKSVERNLQMTENDKCPICNHETFINEYGDIQCSNCRRVLPIDIEREKKENTKNIGMAMVKKMIRAYEESQRSDTK